MRVSECAHAHIYSPPMRIGSIVHTSHVVCVYVCGVHVVYVCVWCTCVCVCVWCTCVCMCGVHVVCVCMCVVYMWCCVCVCVCVTARYFMLWYA